MSLKLFHVIESFDGQATEGWLRSLVEVSIRDGKDYKWTFFCTSCGEGRGDEEAHRVGARVLHAPVPLSSTTLFARSLRRALKHSGCEVLHCHHDVLSGLYLLASVGLPIRKRIVHVHNTSLTLPTSSRAKERVARPILRNLCLRMADNVAGVSKDALRALTRGDASRKRRDLVIPGGVDMRPFRGRAMGQRLATRRSLGVADGELALLFAGRLVKEKNPAFCLKVLQSVKQSGAGASLLFAGEGALREVLADEARHLGLAGSVKLLGFREDLADLMLASDMLLWTAQESPKEGLGLVVVEAQAAGLGVLASRSIPNEAVVVPEIVHFIGLGEGPSRWAGEVMRIANEPRPSRKECLARVEGSPISLEASAKALFQLYDEAYIGGEGRR